ncbi:MAG: DUF1732 domain-containing protein [Bradymonadales bacterium]
MMTYSMTGFGLAQGELGIWGVDVEVKTLNHRSLDLRVSMQSLSGSLDSLFQKLVKQHMGRGRIEICVNIKHRNLNFSDKHFNETLFEERVAIVNEIFKGAWNINKCREFVLGMTDLWTERPELPKNSEALMSCVLETTQIALERCNEARRREGKSLRNYLINAIDELNSAKEAAISRVPERITEYRQRLEERISMVCAELKMPLDERQLALEVAMLADKIDVTEEFTRIGAHISALRILVLSTEGPVTCVGKKIDFYLQELNREVTTVASKSRDTLLTRYTIDMRTQIESMREQAANIQ